MEIKSFRDLWGFCREQAGFEPMKVCVDGVPTGILYADMVDGEVVLDLRVSPAAEPVPEPEPLPILVVPEGVEGELQGDADEP